MTDTMPTTDPMSADNRSMIGRDEIDDLESILAVTNTDRDEVVHHVQNHAERSSRGTTRRAPARR
jgi:hypothetical protein